MSGREKRETEQVDPAVNGGTVHRVKAAGSPKRGRREAAEAVAYFDRIMTAEESRMDRLERMLGIS